MGGLETVKIKTAFKLETPAHAHLFVSSLKTNNMSEEAKVSQEIPQFLLHVGNLKEIDIPQEAKDNIAETSYLLSDAGVAQMEEWKEENPFLEQHKMIKDNLLKTYVRKETSPDVLIVGVYVEKIHTGLQQFKQLIDLYRNDFPKHANVLVISEAAKRLCPEFTPEMIIDTVVMVSRLKDDAERMRLVWLYSLTEKEVYLFVGEGIEVEHVHPSTRFEVDASRLKRLIDSAYPTDFSFGDASELEIDRIKTLTILMALTEVANPSIKTVFTSHQLTKDVGCILIDKHGSHVSVRWQTIKELRTDGEYGLLVELLKHRSGTPQITALLLETGKRAFHMTINVD
jgi:hypothetical protein